jgi:hypothetical protein
MPLKIKLKNKQEIKLNGELIFYECFNFMNVLFNAQILKKNIMKDNVILIKYPIMPKPK